jgi:uncharacterized protein (UPF0305 family)
MYRHGIIDDMYSMGYIPLIADYSRLPKKVLDYFEYYKDRPLHPSDTEQYFLYPGNYTVRSTVDYPEQKTI